MSIKELTNARKQNMKIYSLYRSISLDLIFYYAVDFLFLTQVKGLEASQIVLSSSFYAVFMIFLQIPTSIIVDKIGTKICMVLGNLFNVIYLILIMNCSGLPMLIFAQFISSLCYSIKGIADVALLRYSIPDTNKKGEIFAKLEGKGFQNYFFIASICSAISGFLFVINPYIPMGFSLSFTIISTIISLGFKDVEKVKIHLNQKEKITIKKYIKDLFDSLKFIIKSQRLRSLFLYGGISWGIFCLIGTYKTSLLVDIGTPTQVITILAAIFGICSSIGSKKQTKFNSKFKNKTLTIILLSVTFSIFISGITGKLLNNYYVAVIIITTCFMITSFNKGMSLVLVKRYLGNFSSEKILTQIYAANAIVQNILRAMIGFVGAYLLDITTTANSMIIVGLFMAIISLSLISYMKTRLGLKPEEYNENEIYDKNVLN